MAHYQDARVKVTSTQLNKLKSAVKINKKKFQEEELTHDLFLTIRQTTKILLTKRNNKKL